MTTTFEIETKEHVKKASIIIDDDRTLVTLPEQFDKTSRDHIIDRCRYIDSKVRPHFQHRLRGTFKGTGTIYLFNDKEWIDFQFEEGEYAI